MLAINVPPDLEERLTELAAKSGECPEHIAAEALLTYIEDLEDGFIAIERLKSHQTPIPLEELERRLASEQSA